MSGLKSLVQIAINDINDVDQHTTENQQATRLGECNTCPSLIKLTGNCGECGCFVKLKTQYKQEECPLQKWSKEI